MELQMESEKNDLKNDKSWLMFLYGSIYYNTK